MPGENGHEAALHFIDQNTVVYTSDGGRTWLSSATKFPAMIDDSSLPARDRGYVVGEHGMVDRYRIVPANFNAREFFRRPQSSEVPGSNAQVAGDQKGLESMIVRPLFMAASPSRDELVLIAPRPRPRG